MNKHYLSGDTRTVINAAIAQTVLGYWWHHDSGFDVLVPPLPEELDESDIVFSFSDGPFQFVPDIIGNNAKALSDFVGLLVSELRFYMES